MTSDQQPIGQDGSYGYKKLRVWQAADQLAHRVYQATKGFPRAEQFGLMSQLRRAAVSVPTNLVEGQARKGRREFKQFVSIALGSLAEVEYLLEFSRHEGFLSTDEYQMVESVRKETGRLLWGFYKSL